MRISVGERGVTLRSSVIPSFQNNFTITHRAHATDTTLILLCKVVQTHQSYPMPPFGACSHQNDYGQDTKPQHNRCYLLLTTKYERVRDSSYIIRIIIIIIITNVLPGLWVCSSSSSVPFHVSTFVHPPPPFPPRLPPIMERPMRYIYSPINVGRRLSGWCS